MKNNNNLTTNLFFCIVNCVLVSTIIYTVQKIPFIDAETIQDISITNNGETFNEDNEIYIEVAEPDYIEQVDDFSEAVVQYNPNENNLDIQTNESDYLFTFTGIDGDSVATITGYTGTSLDIILPETAVNTSAGWNTPSVVKIIGNSAFNNKKLTSVVISDQIETIGNGAFQRNNLTSIVIPDSVTLIGTESFQINKLVNVSIGNSVMTIGGSAFLNNQIEEVTLGNSVTTIESRAFQTNKLTNIDLPDSVITIAASAFYGNELSQLMIPDNVVTLGNSSFSNNNLTSVNVGNGVTFVGTQVFAKSPLETLRVSSEKFLFMKELFDSAALTAVSVKTILETTDGVVEYTPETLSEYKVNTVSRSLNLNVTIPTRYQLGSLNSYLWIEMPKTVEWFKNSISTGTKNTNLTLPNITKNDEGSYFAIAEGTQLHPIEVQVEDYQYEFTGTDEASEAVIMGYLGTETDIKLPSMASNYEDSWNTPSLVTSIGEKAFINKNIENVSIPNGIKKLGESCFKSNFMTTIVLPDNLVNIEKSVFHGNPLEAIYVSWEHLERYKDLLSGNESMAGVSAEKTVLLSDYDFSYEDGTEESYVVNEGESLSIEIKGTAYETFNDNVNNGSWYSFPIQWIKDNDFLVNTRNLELNQLSDDDSGIYTVIIGEGKYMTKLSDIEVSVIPSQDRFIPHTNPKNPIVATQHQNLNTGALSIRYASSFSFGQIAFNSKPQNLFSSKQMDSDGNDIPHMITIQDTRERKIRNGWVLTVKQNKNLIEGSELYLKPYVDIDNSVNYGVFASLFELLLNEDSQVVASVKGDGTTYAPGILSIGLAGSGTEGVRLNIPKGIGVGIGNYRSTLTWMLSEGP